MRWLTWFLGYKKVGPGEKVTRVGLSGERGERRVWRIGWRLYFVDFWSDVR